LLTEKTAAYYYCIQVCVLLSIGGIFVKRYFKKRAAGLLALTVLGGALSVSGSLFAAEPVLTAAADEKPAVYDEGAGSLVIKGRITRKDILPYADRQLRTIRAEKGAVLPEDSSRLFKDISASVIDLSEADSTKVKNMKEMFSGCAATETIDLGGLDTSAVKDMSGMFENCTALSYVDLSSFEMKPDTKMDNIISNCPGLLSSVNTLKGASITLDGNIGVNFIADLSSSAAKAVLSGPQGDVVYTDFKKLRLSGNQYKFTYKVNALQLSDDITLRLYDNKNRLLILRNSSGRLRSFCCEDYSVKDYISSSALYSTDEKLNVLLRALDNYGKASENYFGGGTEKHTVDGISDVRAADVAEYAPSFTKDQGKLSLVLNSETAIRLYAKGASDGTSSYGSYCEVTGLAAHRLMNEHKVVIDGRTYSFSAMSYVYRVLTGKTDKETSELARALYVYAEAAKAYRS
jgi:surface protein